MHLRLFATIATLVSIAGLAACNNQIVHTSPFPVSDTTAVVRNDLIVPSDLEVRSATYSITALSEVDGNHGSTSSLTQVRPIISVFATRKGTGEQFILIYEDLAQRKEPSQIIRVVQS